MGQHFLEVRVECAPYLSSWHKNAHAKNMNTYVSQIIKVSYIWKYIKLCNTIYILYP